MFGGGCTRIGVEIISAWWESISWRVGTRSRRECTHMSQPPVLNKELAEMRKKVLGTLQNSNNLKSPLNKPFTIGKSCFRRALRGFKKSKSLSRNSFNVFFLIALFE